jgi:hypothetical protein
VGSENEGGQEARKFGKFFIVFEHQMKFRNTVSMQSQFRNGRDDTRVQRVSFP